jgi:DUF177 domain-containing protein
MSLYLEIAGCGPGVHFLDGEENAAAFGFPEQAIAVEEPVRLGLRITRDAATIVVAGRVDVTAKRTCDRCLAPFTEDVSIDLREVYHLGDKPLPIANPDDDDEVHFVDRRVTRLDIAPVIRQRVLLELPMKALCREDCRGLCPTCGANLNEGTCACDAAPTDPRWQALQDLRDDDQENRKIRKH